MNEINNDNMKDDIKTIISKVARIEKDSIKDESSLRKDLWIDSLQAIQIIALIEDKFNVKIDEIEILNVDTFTDVLNLVKEYLVEQQT